VRAEDGHRALRHLRQLLDENRALGLQAVDDELVVNDLVAHVDRRAVFLERPLDDLDRPHDARAEAARLRQNDLHCPPGLLFASSWRPAVRGPSPFRTGAGRRNLGRRRRTALVVNRSTRTHL